MIHHCGLPSHLLLLLLVRILLLLVLCGTGSLTEMETGHTPSILTVDSPDYFLFTGDLAVNYTLGDAVSSDDVQVQLINHVEGTQIAVFPLPSNSSEGQLVVPCGTVSSAGKIFFALSLKDSDLVVAVSEIVQARWPPVTILTSTGTHSFTALTDYIAIDIIIVDWERLTCPRNDSNTEYSVSLDYYGSSDWRSSPDSPSPRSVHKITITKLFDRKQHSLTFHCRIVDQAGDYLVVLRSPKSLTIAVSEYLEVHWNSESYELRSTLAAIFPCSDDVIVSFTRPRCAANDDKVRLYRQLRQENVTLASSSTLSYVAERRTPKSSNHVAFGCIEFEEELAPSYCWKYVSTARSGATYEHRTLCLPATTKDRPTNGQWSTWSEWSSCSATCLAGTQVRFRSCDNPPPANGGAFCDGPMTESRQCDVICPELSLPTTTYYHFASTNSSCDCGCRLTEPEGTVVAVPGCPSVAQWVIAVKDGLTIRLTFHVFDLEDGGHASVKVRDGESALSNLLLNSFGTGSPKDVVSTGSVMTIEFRAPVNSSGGFVAKYSAQVRNLSLADGGPQTKSASASPVWKSAVIVVGVSLCVAVITIAVVIVCCDVGANRAKRRKKRLNTKGHTVAFDNVPKTQELDYEEVPNNIRIEGPGGLEIVRVYPSTGSDDITPAKFLATSSPYLDEGRERHSSSSGMKRSRTRAIASERNVSGGLEPTSAALGLLPVDEHPVASIRHSSKTGTHQRHLHNEEGEVRHKRRSKPRDRKPPPPSSTFEEDLLMLERQNEVTGGGGVAVTVDNGLGPWSAGMSPDPSKFKSSPSSRQKPKHDASEKIPLQSIEVKGRTPRKNRTHRSSSRPRVTTQGDEVTGRGHRVVVGQRPPVEGSYDTVPDSSFRTSADVTVERKVKVQGQTSKDGSSLNLPTVKDGSTFKDGSGVVMTVTVECNPRITDSEKLRRKLDQTSKNNTSNNDVYGSDKNASSSRTAQGSATRDTSDRGLHIQSFLRPDHPGPDGQSQGGTFNSNSNSFTCSNSPSFRMSTERTSTHSTFRPVPPCPQLNHQSPKATPCPAAKSSSLLRPRITPQTSTSSGPVCPPSIPVSSSSPGEYQVLNRPDHNLAEEVIDETMGLTSGRKTESRENGTIPSPL